MKNAFAYLVACSLVGLLFSAGPSTANVPPGGSVVGFPQIRCPDITQRGVSYVVSGTGNDDAGRSWRVTSVVDWISGGNPGRDTHQETFTVNALNIDIVGPPAPFCGDWSSCSAVMTLEYFDGATWTAPVGQGEATTQCGEPGVPSSPIPVCVPVLARSSASSTSICGLGDICAGACAGLDSNAPANCEDTKDQTWGATGSVDDDHGYSSTNLRVDITCGGEDIGLGCLTSRTVVGSTSQDCESGFADISGHKGAFACSAHWEGWPSPSPPHDQTPLGSYDCLEPRKMP